MTVAKETVFYWHEAYYNRYMAIGDNFTVTKPDFGKNPLIFFKEAFAELKKVTWPTRSEVIKLTGVVIVVSALVGLYLGGLDFLFTKAIALILSRS